jgi:ABC-type sugar transport system permease subunit
VILNQSLDFLVCWGIQDLLWWKNWILMMPSSLVFLLLMFLPLLLTIWFSLVLAGLAVFDCDFFVL